MVQLNIPPNMPPPAQRASTVSVCMVDRSPGDFMIMEQNQQDDKVNASCKQAPEKFAASLPVCYEAGKEGGNEIDCGGGLKRFPPKTAAGT